MSVPALFGIVARRVRPWLSKNLRAHTILAGPLRGARIVTSWHDYPAGISGATELPLLAWFQRHVRPGTTWLDVGAHYGYTAVALSRLVSPSGRVFAFEPMLATAGCVARTRRLNQLEQLTVVPQALGCPDTLTTVRLPTTRGMADRTLTSTTHAPSESELFQVARFDWLWPQINGGNPAIDGIKIDVQGMELDVIAGMRRTLEEQRPKLVIELHRGVDRAAMLRLLEAAGYSAVAEPVEPIADGSAPGLLDDRSYAFDKAAGGHDGTLAG
jgi:FkbM family methyltransferase